LPKQEYDVLIIGSGHSGGMAANVLTQRGISCLMLDAGPEVDLAKNRTTKAPWDLPYRGFNKPGRLPHVVQATEFNANQWVDDKEVPYTNDPAKPYNWVRVRFLGGRSLFWGRQSFRMSDWEFKAADIDGIGDNWPVSHAELDPFYSRAEAILRVSGRKEGQPHFPDGNFLDADYGPDSTTVTKITEIAKSRGILVSKIRASNGRNGQASSVNLLLPDALATGKLQIVTNAIVRGITVDKNTGRANGANFVDRHSGQELHVKARVVVMAAGTLESTRLLLNSGIANSSGVLGHYVMDQLYGVQVVASVPEARGGNPPEGMMGGTALLPRFRNLKKGENRNYIKGYGMMIASGGGASPGFFKDYGEELQKKLDLYAGSCMTASIYGERVPRFENHVRIDKTVRDAWGIPVLHIDVKDGANEYNMAKDAADTAEDMLKTAGWDILSKTDKFHPPGYSIHEVGSCRMGDNPKTSVLNKWNQSHDIKNLFVVDGGCFVTCGWQNSTLTILALAMRASEYLADQMKAQAI
jgi:choline dehydrogenase-like flavoprotein